MKAISRHPGGMPDDLAGAVDVALEPAYALAARANGVLLQKLSSSQLQALLTIETQGPVSLGGLAEALGIMPSTATRLVQRMLSADLVSRETDEHDRRAVVLTLTPTGRRYAVMARRVRRSDIQAALDDMTEAERRAMLRGLRLLAEHLPVASPAPSSRIARNG